MRLLLAGSELLVSVVATSVSADFQPSRPKKETAILSG